MPSASHDTAYVVHCYGGGAKRAIPAVLFALIFSGMGVGVFLLSEDLLSRGIGLLFVLFSYLFVEQEANHYCVKVISGKVIVTRGPLPTFFRWTPLPIRTIQAVRVLEQSQENNPYFFTVVLHHDDVDALSPMETDLHLEGDKQEALDLAQDLVSIFNRVAPAFVLKTSVTGRSYYSVTNYEWVRQDSG